MTAFVRSKFDEFWNQVTRPKLGHPDLARVDGYGAELASVIHLHDAASQIHLRHPNPLRVSIARSVMSASGRKQTLPPASTMHFQSALIGV
jgi:hypothetical protein